MSPFEIGVGDTRDFLDAVIAGFAVLGGMMAYLSGLYAARARAEEASPGMIAESIDEGIAEGFVWGVPLALLALIIVVWS